MNRIDTYTRQIRRDFKWENIRAEAWREGYCFLGSVFSLTPSGKFYMPFACSNVMGCRRCKGTGSVNNRKGSEVVYNALDAACTVLLHKLWETEGMAVAWSDEAKARMAKAREERDQYRASLTCTWCRGSGSHEAAMDEDWQEALTRVAGEHGLVPAAPEGADGCDVWLSDPDSPAFAEPDEDDAEAV